MTMSGDDATRQRLADEARQRLAAARPLGTAERVAASHAAARESADWTGSWPAVG